MGAHGRLTNSVNRNMYFIQPRPKNKTVIFFILFTIPTQLMRIVYAFSPSFLFVLNLRATFFLAITDVSGRR